MTEQEFNDRVLPLAKYIYSFAIHMIGNPDDAADVTQDIMIKLWDSRRKLKRVNNLKAWALKITRNLCLDWLKKQKPVYDEEQILGYEGYDTDVLKQIEARDTVKAVRQMINTLPQSQREVMILREIEELDFDEIAEITGLGVNNIRVLLSRGRTKVKELLTQNDRFSPFER